MPDDTVIQRYYYTHTFEETRTLKMKEKHFF